MVKSQWEALFWGLSAHVFIIGRVRTGVSVMIWTGGNRVRIDKVKAGGCSQIAVVSEEQQW